MVKRILFTAPVTYQDRLREALDKAQPCSLNALFRPLVNTSLLTTDNSFTSFCAKASAYDDIICSSIMAVNALAASGLERSMIDGKVIAIGNDQKAVMDLLGVTVAMPDAEPSMMGIVEALKGLPSLSQRHIAVLLPQFVGLPVPSTITRFLDALSLTGAAISHVYCYRTAAMEKSRFEEMTDTLRQEHIDAIAVTSGGEAYVLSQILAFAASQGHPVKVPVYSFGPYTTCCAQEASLHVTGTSPRHHCFSDFIAYLEKALPDL